MIDFTGVTAIAIPEGNVIKITRGEEILWEKPSADQEPIVVFPATTLNAMPQSGGVSYTSDNLVLSRGVNVGESYVIYFDGTAYPVTAAASGSSITLNAEDGSVELTSVGSDNTTFTCKLSGWVFTLTIEIHYIPA